MNLRFFKSLLVGLSILLTFPSLAQEAESSNYSKEEFIQDFKNGVLLVRLQDRSLSMSEMEKRGMTEQMEALAAQQRRENREIMLSFKSTFNFCPVYFFYAKNSEAIRSGDFTGKVFDANLEPVDISTGGSIFTAEFGETEKLGIDGLIIRDSQMLALKEPLPYFERRYVFFGLIERSKARMIELYNKKLHDYDKLFEKGA
ncbi:MAG: hypothetical protein ACPGVV_05610 [Croceimicrobium sp.]